MTDTITHFPYEEMPLKRQTQARVTITRWTPWETETLLSETLRGWAVREQTTVLQHVQGSAGREGKGKSPWATSQVVSHHLIQRGKQFVLPKNLQMVFSQRPYLRWSTTKNKHRGRQQQPCNCSLRNPMKDTQELLLLPLTLRLL